MFKHRFVDVKITLAYLFHIKKYVGKIYKFYNHNMFYIDDIVRAM